METVYYDESYFLTSVPNINENDNLREPQKIAYVKIYEHFIEKKNTSDAIIVLPTGVGKTGLMGLLPYGISKGRVLIITPQLVIKDSVVGSLDPEYPENFWITRNIFNDMKNLPVLIEYEGKSTKDEWLYMSNIVVVNAQKLQSRLSSSLIKRVASDFFDMIIIDEAHHSTASTWVDTLQYFSNAKVIKLTGTPFRSDGEKIVGETIYNYKLSSAMAHQYVKSLENFEYIPNELYLTIDNDESKTYTVEQIWEMKLKDQDWISRTVALSPECSEKIVIESIRKLEEKLLDENSVPHKIIAVACSIKHAEQIKDLYEKHDYSATIIHSDMNKKEKAEALSDVENHRVKVVINIAMLGEGYDHPYLSVAAIFRPFRNLLPYAQFVGRVLRTIPNEEALRASDNIASIVCHRDYYLDDLWNYYKKEQKESETIKYLENLNLEEKKPNSKGKYSDSFQTKDKSAGTATEKGDGNLVGDTFLNTQLLEQRKKEEEEELKKIKAIQETLNITAEEARKLIKQVQGTENMIKRPDLFINRKRTGIDARIKEDMVSSLLNKFNLPKDTDELKVCRIFKGQYFWIAKNYKDNAAMLAIYITNVLNDMIGAKRDEWVSSDWDIAEKKLDKIEEYLLKVLEELVS